MIIYKSPDEIDKMRTAGRIVAGTIDRVLAAVAPGTSTADLDAVADRYILEQHAVPSFKGYRGFPATICTSLNEEIVHGIPSPKRLLKEGDLLSLDFGAIWEGFHADSAVTVFVGGQAPFRRGREARPRDRGGPRGRHLGRSGRAAGSPTSRTPWSRWPSAPGSRS